jgi:hypothetical protein
MFFSYEDITIDLHTISVVWWFGIEPPVMQHIAVTPEYAKWIGDETVAALTTILLSLDCPFINHPNNMISANNKLRQLLIASQLGISTPMTIVSNNPNHIREFTCSSDKFVFKTFSHPTIRRNNKEYVIYTSSVKKDDLDDFHALSCCINYFQVEIAKRVEYRVTVVGKNVFSCEIHSQCSDRTKMDWRDYDISNTPHYPVELPEDIAEVCRKITNILGLRYSTIDLILDSNGKYWFLELNPNGLWAWIEMLTGLPISRSIALELSTLRKHSNRKRQNGIRNF